MVRSHQQIENDKMATVSNGIGVAVQYEHLHTIISLQFFIGLGICLCQCERIVILVNEAAFVFLQTENGIRMIFCTVFTSRFHHKQKYTYKNSCTSENNFSVCRAHSLV